MTELQAEQMLELLTHISNDVQWIRIYAVTACVGIGAIWVAIVWRLFMISCRMKNIL